MKIYLIHFKVILVFLLIGGLMGCSTREVSEQFTGSTEQRLITHSLDDLMTELPEIPLKDVAGKKVFMQTHFIKLGELIEYATSRLRAEINKRYHPEWVYSESEADYSLDVFFTSLGTDKDSFGLSIPLPVQGQGTAPAKIPLLSFEMFHGISEMYLYLTDTATNEVQRLSKRKVELRNDKIATPILTIPVSSVD